MQNNPEFATYTVCDELFDKYQIQPPAECLEQNEVGGFTCKLEKREVVLVFNDELDDQLCFPGPPGPQFVLVAVTTNKCYSNYFEVLPVNLSIQSAGPIGGRTVWLNNTPNHEVIFPGVSHDKLVLFERKEESSTLCRWEDILASIGRSTDSPRDSGKVCFLRLCFFYYYV